MNKQDLMKWAMIAGGAYLAYWYVNNHGPSGAVFDAAGNKISLSFWDTWFGAAQPATVTQMPTQSQTTLPQQPVSQTAPATALPPATGDIRALIASQSASDPAMATGTASAWQWAYYWNQNRTPLSDVGTVFADPAQLITLDAFLDRIHGAGLSGMVPTMTVPQVPSMSFGGGNLASMWKRKGTIN